MTRFTLLLSGLLAMTACGGVGPKYTGNVRVADARLVTINPDVQTFADADQPIFLSRGAYWLFHDGRWFRAKSASGPWTHHAEPPVPIAQIDQPFAYVHYKRDRSGKQIEVVATGEDMPAPAREDDRPARERPAPGVDPSVDPTLNMFRR